MSPAEIEYFKARNEALDRVIEAVGHDFTAVRTLTGAAPAVRSLPTQYPFRVMCSPTCVLAP